MYRTMIINITISILVSVVYFLDDQFGLSVNKKYDLAISSLGACVWYLKRCCIEHQLLSLQNFQVQVVFLVDGNIFNCMSILQWYEPLDRSVSPELEGSKNGFNGQRMVCVCVCVCVCIMMTYISGS